MHIGIVVFAVLSAGLGVLTAAFYLVVCLKPELVWALNAPDDIRRAWRASRRGRWYHIALVFIAMFGTGICVQSGVSELLVWIPKSWRSNGVWMAESIGGLCGVMAGFMLPIGVLHLSSKLGQQHDENRELKALVRRLYDERQN